MNLLLWLLLDVLAAAARYPVVGIIAGKPANFMHFSDGFPMKKNSMSMDMYGCKCTWDVPRKLHLELLFGAPCHV